MQPTFSADGGVTPKEMWRLNDPRRTQASVKDDVIGRKGGPARNFCCYNEALNLFDMHPQPEALRVIVCTCGGAAMLHEAPLAGTLRFSHVLVDEAGQALIPETLIPLTLADPKTRILLCGDPQQLGPVVHSALAASRGLSQSLLERFMRAPGYRNECHRQRSTGLVTKLLRNYRSHSKLLELPSRLFYDKELIATAAPEAVAPPSAWEELSGRDFPILFYGVKGQQMREGESPSYFNPVEAVRLVELLVGLLQHPHVKPSDIGVMAPYRTQVQKLRLLLREKNLASVRVGTVDDYQGQEERIVFISTVLTRPNSLRLKERPADAHIGLLGNAKRFNVAITRAKALLVVVGHPLVLVEDPNWRELLKYCLAWDAYRGAGSEMVRRYVPLGSASRTLGAEGPSATFGRDAWSGGGQLAADSESMGNPLSEEMIRKNRGETETSGDEGEEISRAIERIAELSLLGMGDRDRMFPETVEEMYSAFSEDLEWRVML